MSKRKTSGPQVISPDGEEIVIKSQIRHGGNSKTYICNYRGKSYVIKFLEPLMRKYHHLHQGLLQVKFLRIIYQNKKTKTILILRTLRFI